MPPGSSFPIIELEAVQLRPDTITLLLKYIQEQEEWRDKQMLYTTL